MKFAPKDIMLAYFGIRLEHLLHSAGGFVQAEEDKFCIDKPRIQIALPDLCDFDQQLFHLNFAINFDVDSHRLVVG